MIPYASTDIVTIWELGRDRPPWHRALLLLLPAFPDRSLRQLAALSIGTRNCYLLTLREMMFGPTLEAFAVCPRCRQPLEFSVPLQAIRFQDIEQPVEREQTLQIDGITVRFRPLTSNDLATLRSQPLADARLALIRRCLLDVRYDNDDVHREAPAFNGSPDCLPAKVIAAMAERLSECDAQAVTSLALACPSCHLEWSASLDIVAFMWSEIVVQAQRLLREVHTLASTYGWSEEVILNMTASRRQRYLDMIGTLEKD